MVAGRVVAGVAGRRNACMVRAVKILQLNFLPRSADVALLGLRLWFGLAMAILHGWPKLMNFGSIQPKFVNFLGLGPGVSLGLATFAELGAALMLALGLWTRLNAVVLGITMGVAFWQAHGGRLSGPESGEMAFLYLGVCVVLFVSGGGRYAVDAALGGKG